MEESKVVVRYGCDRCNRIFESLEQLTKVDVKFLRKSDYGREDIAFDSRKELVCDDCLIRKDTRPWAKRR